MNTQCRLLLTRPKVKSAIFAAALEKAAPGRFTCTIAPVLEIVPLAVRIATSGAQGVLFTSATAVDLAVQQADLRGLACVCVGPATTSAALAHGLNATNAEGTADDVLRVALAVFQPGAGRLLHVRGVHAAGDLAAALSARGLETQTIVIYDQRPLPVTEPVALALATGRFDAITFFSPRSAEIFASFVDPTWKLPEMQAYCLSASVAKKLLNLPFKRVIVAESPNSVAMIDSLTAIRR